MLDWPDFEMVFPIGGYGRRQWAVVSAVIEKSSPNSVQADEKLVCYWSSGVGERELYSLRLVSNRGSKILCNQSQMDTFFGKTTLEILETIPKFAE
ncbi:hypothetical protein TNCV_4834991 [Trichonephila clavipes]|nr:hypothetical protein TNCV_4834991 [Trichonephila clavipes]